MNRTPTIVSLVPSWTDTVIYLGGRSQLIGRTKFCIHPEDLVQDITKIGGTKNIQTEQIIQLNPDVVIANKEENVREQVEELQRAGIRVWLSDCSTMKSAITEIIELGEIIGREQEAQQLVDDITMSTTHKEYGNQRVCYLIWKDPYMSVGMDTYIHDVLSSMGLENIFKDRVRYPAVSIPTIKEKSPDHILLSSEPFPFKESHRKDMEQALGIPCHIVDGEVFSWYGSKMLSISKYAHHLHSQF